MNTEFGPINGHLLGIFMKEMVRRALSAIRAVRQRFEIAEKTTVGKERDFCTTADRDAQQVYLKSITECFPTAGIIAEEDNFRRPAYHPTPYLFFSVDPA